MTLHISNGICQGNLLMNFLELFYLPIYNIEKKRNANARNIELISEIYLHIGHNIEGESSRVGHPFVRNDSSVRAQSRKRDILQTRASNYTTFDR